MGIIFQRNCYYINPKEQNLDSKSNIVYIHSVNLRGKNFINEDNIIDIKKENNINEEIDEEEIKKKKTENNSLNLNDEIIKEEDECNNTYIDNQIIINNNELNYQINKIQRAFRKSLKHKQEKEENEEKENIDIPKISNNFDINYNSIKKKKSFDKKIKENILQEDLIYTKEQTNQDLKVSDEIIIKPTYTHQYKNYLPSKNNSNSSSFSLPFLNDSIEISNLEKGNFISKKKKYIYKGGYNLKKKKEGFGIIKWEDKSILKAKFHSSKINGYAYYYDYPSNTTFLGYYEDNYPKGFGIYNKDNIKIIGDSWLKNNIKNIAIEISDNDNYYQGELSKSIKNGIGLYRWSNGSIYLGEWYDNKMNGIGLMKYFNDSIYFGEFKNDLMNGWGEFLWGDFKYYCGNYVNNLKSGFGIFVWDFNSINAYIGFWEFGKQNGIGIQITHGKEKVGYFKEGRRTILLNGPWEIKDYLKSEQFKYQKFLEMNVKDLSKFVRNLKNFLKEDDSFL